jgi:hypothetical protein
MVFAEKVWRSGEAFDYTLCDALIVAGLVLPWLPPMHAALLS